MSSDEVNLSPRLLVTRHFRIDRPNPDDVREALQDIQNLADVQDVTWQDSESTFNVLFEPGIDHLKAVPTILSRWGLVVLHDWRERLADTLWRFDDNLVRVSVDTRPRRRPDA
ncbi:MAG TPA: hypothetical protein VLA56_01735 [Pseudomonadales bacterium]|nr:hypothetical protein [Pseudomonadales bacterium]